MARTLFQPTFRSSQLSAPSIQGADIGAFGKAIADMRINDLKERQLALSTQQAEQALDDQKRNRDFLTGYNYQPKQDTTLIDRDTLTKLGEQTSADTAKVFKREGVTDYNALSQEGKAAIDSIGQRAITAMQGVPRDKATVKNRVFEDVIKNTGNYDLANKMSESVASSYLSKEDLFKNEEKLVDNYNKDIKRQQDHLYKMATLNKQRLKSGKSDKKDYAPNYDVLQDIDYDLTLVDSFGAGQAGDVQDIINTGRKNNLPSWAIDKAIRNSIKREATGDHLIGSNADIVRLANYYTQQDSSGGNSPIDVPLLQTATARRPEVILRDAIINAYNRNVTPSSSRVSNTPSENARSSLFQTPQQKVRNLQGGGNIGGTVSPQGSGTSKPNPEVVPRPEGSINNNEIQKANSVGTPNEEDSRLLESFINFGRNVREGNNFFSLSPSKEVLERRSKVIKDNRQMWSDFLESSLNTEVENQNDIRMKIATGKPITQEEYNAVFSSLPTNLKSLAEKQLIK